MPSPRADAPLSSGVSATMTRRQFREAQEGHRARLRAPRRARSAALTLHLPRVGIVAALGLATVVAPLVGGGLPLDAGTGVARAADRPAAATQPLVSPGVDSASGFRVIPGDETTGDVVVGTTGAAMPVDQLIASRQEAERASRDLARPALPGCDGVVSNAGAENGRLDIADLCALWEPGDYLRADAAVALSQLNVAYQQRFGVPLVLTDSYRSYSQQVSVRARKPGLAARPGTSEHGWGLAVDLGGGVEAADEHHQWMRENAPRFGWDNPDWARSGGSGPYEPWHWEYVAGQVAANPAARPPAAQPPAVPPAAVPAPAVQG